jgi:hypothetical protein
MTVQQWDPDTYARHARFVSELGAGVVDLLAPQQGEHPAPVRGTQAWTMKPTAPERFRDCYVPVVSVCSDSASTALSKGLRQSVTGDTPSTFEDMTASGA